MKYWQLWVLLGVLLASKISFGVALDQELLVHESADNPYLAKEKAILEASKEALVRLIDQSNFDSIKLINSLSFSQISVLISDLIINSEVITGNNYQAKLSITFDQLELDKWLKNHKLTQKSLPKKILIIPVLVLDQQRLIFDENNDWQKLIKEILQEKTNYLLPIGDTEDSLLVQEILTSKSTDDLLSLLNKYQVQEALIYQVTLKEQQLAVSIINLDDQQLIYHQNLTYQPDFNSLKRLANDLFEYSNNLPKNGHCYLTIIEFNNFNQWLALKEFLSKNNIDYQISQVTINQIRLQLMTNLRLSELLTLLNKITQLNVSYQNNQLIITHQNQ